jgi:CheY-like chemotaxis protein
MDVPPAFAHIVSFPSAGSEGQDAGGRFHMSGIRSVLLIDDSDTSRAITRRQLEVHGYRVYERNTPLGATKEIVQLRIDVVVIDVDMPVMRGDAFAALLRRNPRLAHVAVVLLSGAGKDDLAKAMEEANADGAVRKECAGQNLVPTIEESVRERREAMHSWVPPKRVMLPTPAGGILLAKER